VLYGGRKDNKLEKIWRDLKTAKIIDEFLYLADNKKPYMFVRSCYFVLKDVVLENNVKRLRITGTPGTGKTYFSYYLLHILSLQGKTVVYHKAGKNPILYSEERVLCSESLFTFKEYLDNSNVWYIVDGQHPMEYVAKTILISSPNKSHYKEFDKWGKKLVRYMPDWTFEEIDKCRKVLFDDLSEDKVMKLYLKWGGVPRYVLELANDEAEQKKLEDAISTCTYDIMKYIGEGDTQEDISHKLVHIITNEDGTEYPLYSQKTVKFASHYIGEMVTSKLETSLRYKLFDEMNVTLKFGKSNQIIGRLFEVVAHNLLRKGGVFNVRSLDTDMDKSHKIDPQDKSFMFFNVNEIENGKYYQPYEENFPSIDAILAPKSLFQMSTTLNHNTNISGLEKLESKLTSSIDLYYVVPNVLFNRFQKQDFIGGDTQQQLRWKNRIKQYVLGINISSVGLLNVSRSRNVSGTGNFHGSIRGPGGPRRTGNTYDRRCYKCGKKGHIARYCKFKK
jgi:hypothetical protein